MGDKYLIVGLGNPGRQYVNNRHNLGFMIADELAKDLGVAFGKKTCGALLAQGQSDAQNIIIAKPQSYMNRSGEAVGQLVRYFNIEIDHILVIVDDADLPLGKLRIRKQGSAGGHNGLKSIIAHLSSQEFARLRVGMGRPDENGDMIQHVLSDFSKSEQKVVQEIRDSAIKAIHSFILHGVDQAMNTFNAL